MSKKEESEIRIEELDSQEEKEDYKIKIVVIGDSGVGKTNLIKRFISGTFDQNTKATVGVEFISKSYKINKHIFKIELWDTAGQERYKSITSVYYKGSKGALIVYDVTSKTSFDNIGKWISEIRDKTSKDIPLVLVGNKIDLMQYREVSNDQAMNKAKLIGMPIMETSALDSTNVKEAFYDLLKEIYIFVRNKNNNNDDGKNYNDKDKEGIKIDTCERDKEKKGGCCLVF